MQMLLVHRRKALTCRDQFTLAKFGECFPFSIMSIFQDRCWTVKLSTPWLVVLETKRGIHRPTALCKEGLTWECAIATLALAGWSMLDLAAIQEGGDGRDGTCHWIDLIPFRCSGTSYYLIRGSSLDD